MDLLFNSLSRQGFRTALTISHICGWAGHRLLLKKGNDRVSESRNHVFVQPEDWSLDLRHITLLWHGIWTSDLQPLNAFLSSTGFIFKWFKICIYFFKIICSILFLHISILVMIDDDLFLPFSSICAAALCLSLFLTPLGSSRLLKDQVLTFGVSAILSSQCVGCDGSELARTPRLMLTFSY